MTTPGHITLTQATRLLHIPEPFYRLLANNHYLPTPTPNGEIDAHQLNRARLQHKWLNYLDERMDRVQARQYCGRNITMPADHLTTVAGRDVTELWRIIQTTLLTDDEEEEPAN